MNARSSAIADSSYALTKFNREENSLQIIAYGLKLKTLHFEESRELKLACYYLNFYCLNKNLNPFQRTSFLTYFGVNLLLDFHFIKSLK